ncbi:hypothetical protein [Exiguobacterium oxidotolerans]|uniref:hypothetical protein n=1 Tax=Exiguobacterium oxidotolerans TaxID=223958 RepID=UPI0004944793|nr:hypothetical protein [Exiguobacterium oxidotolerans]
MKRVHVFRRFLAAAFLLYGGYLAVFERPDTLSIALILAGITQLTVDLVFPPNDPVDEKQRSVQSKSGSTTYALSILYAFALLALVHFNLIQHVMTALLIMISLQLLTYPAMLFFYKRVM